MSAVTARYRATQVEIDLQAVAHNVVQLRRAVRPAAVMAVVKADAYGHGAVPVARAALAGGATWLAVALTEEGIELRDAGVDAPILVLSEPPPAAASAVVVNDLTPVVYTPAGVDALAKAVAERGTDPLAVHLKVDTGMHRVGVTPAGAPELAARVDAHAELRLAGVCTHLAIADEPDDPYTPEQLERFQHVLDELAARGLHPPLVHAANSAGAIAFPEARFDLVRAGISIYGVEPAPGLGGALGLRPALRFTSTVAFVKELDAGARVSYGLRYELARRGVVATVPVGYADGVPRNLAHHGAEVLIRGRRFPIAGTVTMDQLLVDVGDAPVEVGDEVVLIGAQGDDEITAWDWANRLGTIAYEIVCGIGPRTPRVHTNSPVRDGVETARSGTARGGD